jgi:hypothetical protein
MSPSLWKADMIGASAVRNIPERVVLRSRPLVQRSPRRAPERDQILLESGHDQQHEDVWQPETSGDIPVEDVVGSHVDLLA